MTLSMTPATSATVKGAHPAQVWAFVCDSRSKDATVVAAYIGLDRAKAHAREINGCTRFGRVLSIGLMLMGSVGEYAVGKVETF